MSLSLVVVGVVVGVGVAVVVVVVGGVVVVRSLLLGQLNWSKSEYAVIH